MIELTICDAVAKCYEDVVGFEGITLDDLRGVEGVLCIVQLKSGCMTGYAGINGNRSLVELKTPRVYVPDKGFVEQVDGLKLEDSYLRKADIKDIFRILRKDEEPLP